MSVFFNLSRVILSVSSVIKEVKGFSSYSGFLLWHCLRKPIFDCISHCGAEVCKTSRLVLSVSSVIIEVMSFPFYSRFLFGHCLRKPIFDCISHCGILDIACESPSLTGISHCGVLDIACESPSLNVLVTAEFWTLLAKAHL